MLTKNSIPARKEGVSVFVHPRFLDNIWQLSMFAKLIKKADDVPGYSGPEYIPVQPSNQGGGWEPDTRYGHIAQSALEEIPGVDPCYATATVFREWDVPAGWKTPPSATEATIDDAVHEGIWGALKNAAKEVDFDNTLSEPELKGREYLIVSSGFRIPKPLLKEGTFWHDYADKLEVEFYVYIQPLGPVE